ncbi:MAG: urea transporter [Alistipes sp.]|nr:urea transporter [Alistipes sp.]
MEGQTTIAVDTPRKNSFDFPARLLRGAGQVMFQNNAWTGFFFLIGIFWGGYQEGLGLVAWGALLGLIVSTVTGYLLGLPDDDGAHGLWGFNGILVGCAFPTFLGNTIWMWLALVLCAALTTWVRTGFNRVMAPWKVNSFTVPFVFCTWIFLLAARAMHGMPPVHMSDPTLPATFTAMGHFGFGDWLVWWLKGIAQVFLIDSWITGIFFLVGLAVSNLWAALWAAIGSAVALCIALILGASGAEVSGGLYGFSAVLTAIALATVFYKPNFRSAIWALLGICVTVFLQASMNMLLAPVGLATLTAPFCIATWLFLLPLIRFDNVEQVDHTEWHHKK